MFLATSFLPSIGLAVVSLGCWVLRLYATPHRTADGWQWSGRNASLERQRAGFCSARGEPDQAVWRPGWVRGVVTAGCGAHLRAAKSGIVAPARMSRWATLNARVPSPAPCGTSASTPMVLPSMAPRNGILTRKLPGAFSARRPT